MNRFVLKPEEKNEFATLHADSGRLKKSANFRLFKFKAKFRYLRLHKN
jgi:hypothetical protein